MGQLCVYLPPFASDYSGVCSALYELDCLTAIQDASCCTEHYVYYDEPRWDVKRSLVFSTQLRNVDAVLGNWEKTLGEILEADLQFGTELLAVVGTPVPAVTGMDMEGMAAVLEARSGKPALGFNTSGFAYYDRGIFLACRALLERFAEEDVPAERGRVNLLGITPLDFGAGENAEDFSRQVTELGWQVGASMMMGVDLDQIRGAGRAERNIAVSSAGLQTAQWLYRRFGTPYTAVTPISPEQTRMVLSGQEPDRPEGTGEILILGDQVISHSLRRELTLRGCARRVDVASFFGWDRNLALPGDTPLHSERQLADLLRERRYRVVLGDPCFQALPGMRDVEFVPLTHPAVSSTLHKEQIPRYTSKSFGEILTRLAGENR